MKGYIVHSFSSNKNISIWVKGGFICLPYDAIDRDKNGRLYISLKIDGITTNQRIISSRGNYKGAQLQITLDLKELLRELVRFKEARDIIELLEADYE